MAHVEVGVATFGDGSLPLIAGPCVIEDESTLMRTAAALKATCDEASVPWVFKASFDKANRTSRDSYRGPGLREGLEALAAVRQSFDVATTTDIHDPNQAERAAEAVDLLQIPAFLCRQTDLLIAAGRTGLPVNIKKGPFMAPEDMAYAVEKVDAAGAKSVMVTERGTSFGHRDLVVDYRGIVAMRKLGLSVVFDATHAAQRPGAAAGRSGGDRRLAPALGRAAVAVGVDGMFAEVHPDPKRARSDSATQLPLDGFGEILASWQAIHAGVHVWLGNP